MVKEKAPHGWTVTSFKKYKFLLTFVYFIFTRKIFLELNLVETEDFGDRNTYKWVIAKTTLKALNVLFDKKVTIFKGDEMVTLLKSYRSKKLTLSIILV